MPNGEKAIIDGMFEPIITKDQFNLAQKLLEKNKHTGGKQSKKYPYNLLSGILRCGYSNQNLNVSSLTRKGRNYSYFTNTTAKEAGICKSTPAKSFEKVLFKLYSLHQENSETVGSWNLLENSSKNTNSANIIADLKDKKQQKESSKENLFSSQYSEGID